MAACYDRTHQVVPEREERLQGPELGLALYAPKYASIVVRVVARSYVWSPEQHHPETGFHGFRRYDWSVIEYKPGSRIVVNDTDLFELRVGTKVAP